MSSSDSFDNLTAFGRKSPRFGAAGGNPGDDGLFFRNSEKRNRVDNFALSSDDDSRFIRTYLAARARGIPLLELMF